MMVRTIAGNCGSGDYFGLASAARGDGRPDRGAAGLFMQTSHPNQREEPEQDNPALSRIIERNIRTMIRLRLKADSERSLQDRAADAVTGFAGSTVFVHLHIAWFTLWVLLNTGRFGVNAFDPFPYGLLTMIVSLEAIFLSTLVLINTEPSGRGSGTPRRLGFAHRFTRRT